MLPLRVDLNEGFEDDTVTVQVNGAEIFCKEAVSTNYSIGVAEVITTEAPAGSLKIHIRVSTRQADKSLETEISSPLFVAVSLSPTGALSFQQSSEEPTYF